jgi:hypothetical protein
MASDTRVEPVAGDQMARDLEKLNLQPRRSSLQSYGTQTLQSSKPSIPELLERCKVLLQELEDFGEYLASRKKQHGLEYRHFRTQVKLEAQSLEKVSGRIGKELKVECVCVAFELNICSIRSANWKFE